MELVDGAVCEDGGGTLEPCCCCCCFAGRLLTVLVGPSVCHARTHKAALFFYTPRF